MRQNLLFVVFVILKINVYIPSFLDDCKTNGRNYDLKRYDIYKESFLFTKKRNCLFCLPYQKVRIIFYWFVSPF